MTQSQRCHPRRWKASVGCHVFLVLLFSSGSALHQSPDTVAREGQLVTLTCSQLKTNYFNMYWYKQERVEDPRLQLVIFTFEDSGRDSAIEKEFLDHFKSPGMKNYQLNLSLETAQLEDSGTYFCAKQDRLTSPLHFGKGTRLTVLGKGEVPSLPNVTIFAPSTQELKEKKKATIVCLVTNFYPDHINLAWSVNGKERIQGVKTETPKKGSTGKYSLISRLRVTSHEWQDSNNKFDCKVDFYNWNEKVSYEEGIHGTVCDGGTAEAKETYLRTANFGKLVYILLIFKSILYGAFVMGLKLWKKPLLKKPFA